MFVIAIFLAFAGIIILAARPNRKIPDWIALIGGISIIIALIIMYGAGVYSNDPAEGIEYTFVAKIDEEVIVYQSYDPVINPHSKRVVRIITGEDIQPGIQPGDTVVLTDNGIKKVSPKEGKPSTG